ncbi:MAG: hypothetical protein ACREIC_02455, partial [Limisphaerales bacterium]
MLPIASGSEKRFLPRSSSRRSIGIKEGLFAEYGIDVTPIDFGGNAKLQQALTATVSALWLNI